jgi:hypothetical protein
MHNLNMPHTLSDLPEFLLILLIMVGFLGFSLLASLACGRELRRNEQGENPHAKKPAGRAATKTIEREGTTQEALRGGKDAS